MIKIIDIFEKVNLIHPIEQRNFFSFLEDTANELMAKYPRKLILNEDAEVCSFDNNLNGEINILPLYEKAIVYNILFLCGAGDTYISEFLRLSDEAYLHYYRLNAKGRRLKRREW